MCQKSRKILRLQFQKGLNNKKGIREINDLLENVVWFNEKVQYMLNHIENISVIQQLYRRKHTDGYRFHSCLFMTQIWSTLN